MKRMATRVAIHTALTALQVVCWAVQCVLTCWARGWGWRRSVRWAWAWASHRALWMLVRER